MKESRKKETIILASSAFILLSALTTTGLYIQSKDGSSNESEYIVDLSKVDEITEELEPESNLSAEAELDYDPEYVFPGQIAANDNIYHSGGEILTDPTMSSAPSMTAPSITAPSVRTPSISSPSTGTQDSEMKAASKEAALAANAPLVEKAPLTESASLDSVETIAPIVEDAEAISMTRQPALAFQESDMLQWPVVGDVLINYSMDKTIYYPTLDQYKYNPGIVISAAQGTTITAPATGRVVSVNKDPQYGNTVVMDLGDGYMLTCGQLDQITVSEGSFVSVGEPIACIGAPTKYFSLEGSNLFLKLEKDGVPISPLSKLQ